MSTSPRTGAPTRAGAGLFAAWLVSLVCATASANTFALFAGLLSRPHSLGARDAQGAVGIVVLILLGSLVVALAAGGLAAWSALKLHRRPTRYVFAVTAVLLTGLPVLMAAVGRFG